MEKENYSQKKHAKEKLMFIKSCSENKKPLKKSEKQK